ncbi:AmmeMemoRadiSam system protein B [Propionibacterium sp.]|uniref:AmmeMemoRadiSam system protein B n=1 Tax=Propionibacterium sp. TaxID=1977903 RepID=UPI0039E9B964
MTSRPPAVAGSFYPARPRALEKALTSAFEAADPPPAELDPSQVKALIVPHAGYVYSGSTAASGYALLRDRTIEMIVLLGPTHRVGIRGMALPGCDLFETPLGEVTVDAELAKAAAAVPMVVTRPDVHEYEHSLEVQLPFLQTVCPQASVLPVAVGSATPAEVGALLNALWGGPETIVIISSDMSHFHRYEEARRIDAGTIDQILAFDDSVQPEQACGCHPMDGLLHVAAAHELHPALLAARNSGDTAGDRARVVGYASFAFQEAS